MDSSLSHELVSQQEYNFLKQELEKEKAAHLETKSKFAVTSEKLEFALGEINILSRQLQKEKDAFHEAFGDLKDTAFQQKCHALMLKQKYEEVEKVCDEQDNLILSKDATIKNLKSRLTDQKKIYKQQLTEKEIHLQQERYIAQKYLDITNIPDTSKKKSRI